MTAVRLTPEDVERVFKREPSPDDPDMARAEKVARSFHHHYESLAPEFNYETRPESAQPWEQVPVAIRELMVASAARVLRDLADEGIPIPGIHRTVPPADRLTVLSVDRPVEPGTTLYIEVQLKARWMWQVQRVGEVQVTDRYRVGESWTTEIASPVRYADPVTDQECPGKWVSSSQELRLTRCSCGHQRPYGNGTPEWDRHRVPLRLYPIGEVHK